MIFRLAPGAIRECQNRAQGRLSGVAAIRFAMAIRNYNNSAMSRTSTASGHPTFGPSKGLGEQEPPIDNGGSSSSSRMDIPPLKYGRRRREREYDIRCPPPPTPPDPRSAEICRSCASGIGRITEGRTRPGIVSRINMAVRAPGVPVGPEESQNKEAVHPNKSTTHRKVNTQRPPIPAWI